MVLASIKPPLILGHPELRSRVYCKHWPILEKKAFRMRTKLAMKFISPSLSSLMCLLLTANLAYANQTTLLPERIVAALSQELSGETAKRNLESIARNHRMRGSRGFRAAAQHIVEQLREYGIADARMQSPPPTGNSAGSSRRVFTRS